MQFDLGIRCDYFVGVQGGIAREERDVFLGISGEKIALVSAWQEKFAAESKKFIHAKNKVALPGFVNAHTHLPMVLFRGVEDDVPFHVWLFERILPFEAELVNRDFIEKGLKLALLESIRFGVTTLNEMYFYVEDAARIMHESGIRGFVAQTWTKFPTPEDKDLGRDKKGIFKRLHQSLGNKSRIRAALGPHAPYSCDEQMFKEIAELADWSGAPIHIHLSETRKEVEDSFKEFNQSPVRRIMSHGLLRKSTICAHSIHFSEEDIQLVKSAGAGVVYNPDSNTKLGSGVAPIARYLELGIPVALGTDGAASNNDLSMFGVMDIGTKLQKLKAENNTAMLAKQAIESATWGGAKVLGIENEIGSLETGKQADITLVDLDFPHLRPIHSVLSQLVYSAQGLEVDTVICAGKLLLENKQFETLDQEKIFSDADKIRDLVQNKLNQLRR